MLQVQYSDAGAEEYMPLLSNLVDTNGQLTATRTATRPSLVNAKQLELIADEVHAEVTIAAEKLIQDLEDRFPEAETLRAFSLLS
jgi:hypothetical protein